MPRHEPQFGNKMPRHEPQFGNKIEKRALGLNKQAGMNEVMREALTSRGEKRPLHVSLQGCVMHTYYVIHTNIPFPFFITVCRYTFGSIVIDSYLSLHIC